MGSRKQIVEPIQARGPAARVEPARIEPAHPGQPAPRTTDPISASREALTVALDRQADTGSRRHFVDGLQPRIGNAATARLLQDPVRAARAPSQGLAVREAPIQRLDGDLDLDAFWPGEAGEASELQEGVPEATTSGTTINVLNTTYSVGGSLLDAANAMAARTEAGSVTSQFSDIAYTTTESGRVVTANITVTETILLPVWTGYASATVAEKAEWDRFRAALQAHEQQHVAIDRAAYTNIHAKLVRKSQTRADEIIDEIETATTALNDAFDTQTDHGRNAGTTINPPTSGSTSSPTPPAPPPAGP
jgi:hypothetical protein